MALALGVTCAASSAPPHPAPSWSSCSAPPPACSSCGPRRGCASRHVGTSPSHPNSDLVPNICLCIFFVPSQECYYQFRDATTPLHVLLPLALLALRATPSPYASALAALHGAYWAWLLWFYTTLALREHVLRINGSSVRSWWIRHHYYSCGAWALRCGTHTLCRSPLQVY